MMGSSYQEGAPIMPVRPLMFIAAAVLGFSASTSHAEDQPVVKPTTVAEMMQKRHENQVREQLLSQGRFDEVRRIDEERSRQQHERQEKIVAQMNEALAHAAKADGSPSLTYECDAVRDKVR
jgi:hypothetical protein